MGHDAVSVGTLALPGVLVIAGGASLIVVGLAIAAFARRRSRSYLLIALALLTLLARSVAGGLAVGELLPVGTHHLMEHSLDGVMAVLLIAAVYFARTTDPTVGGEST
jgi:heme A synthase